MQGGAGAFVLGSLAVALLMLPVLGTGSAQAQSDWLRPPGNVGQPSRQAPPPQQARPTQRRQPQQQQSAPVRRQQQAAPAQPRGWNPFQPLIDLFKPDDGGSARGSANARVPAALPPPATATRPAPAIEAPAEARGTVYATTAAAKEDLGDKLKSVVLVLGDQYAQALAQGLADAFATDRESVAVVGRSEAGSGFAPASPYDWINNGRALVASETPTAVVAFAGSADLAPIDDPAGRAELFDERWRAIYARRIDDFLLGLKLRGSPVFLVGLPPIDDAAGSERNVKLNDILKERASRAGVTYVDVWDGFVDEDGQFMMSGPAVDGQRRRLRLADGMGFTRAGGRKLAFFIDRELGPVLEHNDGPQIGEPGGAAQPSIIMLTGGKASGGARGLAGGPTPVAVPAVAGPQDAAADEAQRLLVRGEPLPTVAGRTDDFTWVPPRRAGEASSPEATDKAGSGTSDAKPATTP